MPVGKVLSRTARRTAAVASCQAHVSCIVFSARVVQGKLPRSPGGLARQRRDYFLYRFV
jgi:hypothetical protein